MILNNKNNSFYLTFTLLSLILLARCSPKVTTSENRFEDSTSNQTEDSIPEEPHYDETEITYANKIYSDKIATVLLHQKGLPMSEPVIGLNSSEILELHFDELDGNYKTYQYRIVHCNRDWTPSDLTEMDYLDGFAENYIEENKYSFNTLQSYVHYWQEFPNENIKFIKSGNYVVIVYEEDQPELPILTKRFMVSENTIQIAPRIKYPSELDDKYYRQELDFTLTYNQEVITNPYSNLHVVIEQNHRTDNQCTGLTPNFARENELVYDYDEENVFDGGNEFRNLDLTTFRNVTRNIADIESTKETYYITVKPDLKRPFKKYLETKDINGKFLIRTIDGNDPNLESDYGHITFTLPYNHPLDKGDLYLFGQLSNWEISDKYRLKYDYDALAYRTNLYLKQGFYNYTYLYVSDTTKSADISLIEGTHFDTENDYQIKVYYQDPAGFYDRLLMYYVANSRKDF